ncbi:17.6 kDa class I heat shock protein 2 [Citrus sinensis]|uniref:17.6 kDa class I heat shock protein 2 n=1 Tax=Citrus sinensis TaxID=2711 RepID=A0ACB8IX81_CITSI|nr:17.6 kDa class I heat shock protein 2 [Citrus sinensis]
MSMIPSFFGNRRSSVFDPFSLDVWDFSSSSQFPQETSAFVNTRVDWKETPEAHVFKADLPGVKKEEVKISGQRKIEKEDKNDTWYRVERSSGAFSRRFRLPENVEVDQIKASIDCGVLTLIIPKAEAKKSNVRAIQISG